MNLIVPAVFALILLFQPLRLHAQESQEGPYVYEVPKEGRLDWGGLLQQNALFLGVQQGFRAGFQQGTRDELKGAYFRDYFKSINGFRGWDDGDAFIANYVAHPLQGATYGYTYLHNHAREKYIPVDFSSGDYWRSRMKALAWSAVASTHYELSPLGDPGIGNVGMAPGTKGAVDLVVTPTAGLAVLLAEDYLDSTVVTPFERRFHNRWARMMVRSFLNPSRSMANLLRFKVPWHRDTRAGIGFSNDAFPRGGGTK